MVYLSYILGLIIYLLSVLMSYSEKTKLSYWYYPVGSTLSIATNFLWMYLAKHSTNGNEVYIRGIVWDSMILFSYSVLPLFVFNVKFTTPQCVGIGFVLFGFALMKIA